MPVPSFVKPIIPLTWIGSLSKSFAVGTNSVLFLKDELRLSKLALLKKLSISKVFLSPLVSVCDIDGAVKSNIVEFNDLIFLANSWMFELFSDARLYVWLEIAR